MEKPFQVWENIYAIGGPDLSDLADCCVYLIDSQEQVMVDAGAGNSFNRLVENIESPGFEPTKLAAIIVTHAHIDHIGSLGQFQEKFGVKLIAHELDSEAIETGKGTGAEFYGLSYQSRKIDHKVNKDEESLTFGSHELKIIHIPGHTPGSIALYVDIAGKRVLFGQDIHGPYYPEWGANLANARASLHRLSELNADILCEEHFGIYQPANEVRMYIERYLQSIRE